MPPQQKRGDYQQTAGEGQIRGQFSLFQQGRRQGKTKNATAPAHKSNSSINAVSQDLYPVY